MLAVDADHDAAALVARLTRRAPEGLRVVLVEQGPDRATVRVDWQPPAPAPAAATDAQPSRDAIDTLVAKSVSLSRP